MIFTKAGPAEILRASQKDDNYTNQLQLLISDILLQLKGTRFSIKYKYVIDTLGGIIYYTVTTLSGYQTLGEEYTGIIQTDSTFKHLPSTSVRALMILFHCFGASFLQSLLKSFERRVVRNREILPEAKEQVLLAIRFLNALVPFIDRLHKAIFYYKGGAYHMSKRLTGVNYVLSRFWLKDKESLYGFKLLSTITTVHLLATALYSIVSYKKSESSQVTESAAAVKMCSSSCSLCMDRVSEPSITPCGHVFCWSCVHSWLQAHDSCPVCRTSLQSNRVVPLFNYS